MYNRDMEIREAIDVGERALRSLREAKSSLNSARGWGMVDIIGGRGLSGLIKHVKIGDAKSSLNRAKYDLETFSRELSDVRDIQEMDIEIGDFLTFADFLFDGFLADMLVQTKIRQAQDKIDYAIDRVETLLGRLRSF